MEEITNLYSFTAMAIGAAVTIIVGQIVIYTRRYRKPCCVPCAIRATTPCGCDTPEDHTNE